jgi:hypothetical protein
MDNIKTRLTRLVERLEQPDALRLRAHVRATIQSALGGWE